MDYAYITCTVWFDNPENNMRSVFRAMLRLHAGPKINSLLLLAKQAEAEKQANFFRERLKAISREAPLP